LITPLFSIGPVNKSTKNDHDSKNDVFSRPEGNDISDYVFQFAPFITNKKAAKKNFLAAWLSA
jgi:hypothetical protein